VGLAIVGSPAAEYLTTLRATDHETNGVFEKLQIGSRTQEKKMLFRNIESGTSAGGR
jgi:hypothetical protein